jgi:hypothetical protein
LQTQAEILPLSLGDSERVAQNDAVYMLSDSGKDSYWPDHRHHDDKEYSRVLDQSASQLE